MDTMANIGMAGMSEREWYLVFASDYPRRVVIRKLAEGEDKVLEFSYDDGRLSAKVFDGREAINYNEMQLINPRGPVFGCIGIVYVEGEPFLGIITGAELSNVMDGGPVFRIKGVVFLSLISGSHDQYEAENKEAGGPLSITQLEQAAAAHLREHPCQSLVRLFLQHTFYFSAGVNLRISLKEQVKGAKKEPPLVIYPNNTGSIEFSWNKHLLERTYSLLKDSSVSINNIRELNSMNMFVTIVQGFVGGFYIHTGEHGIKVDLISRLASNRAGTRMLSRGIDDDGYASNFVESEIGLTINDTAFSFVMVRGSVPVFWEQTRSQMVHRMSFTRSDMATYPAMEAHFKKLFDKYGKVLVLSLLGLKPFTEERDLRDRYYGLIDKLNLYHGDRVHYLEFDYNNDISASKENYAFDEFMERVFEYVNQFSWFCCDKSQNIIISDQSGVIRTNCMDCLDRTNVVQSIIAREVINRQLDSANIILGAEQKRCLDNELSSMWAANADSISRTYTGTRALKTSHTILGKKTVFGTLVDMAKTVERFYNNNFQDKARNESIAILLGRHDKSYSKSGKLELQSSTSNTASSATFPKTFKEDTITVLLGTWNVNGKQVGIDNVLNWLKQGTVKSPGIVSVCVQEIVQLTATQYIYGDMEGARRYWENIILDSLEQLHNVRYIPLSSSRVGALVTFSFIHSSKLDLVKEVKTAQYKTGFTGLLGNKGGAAISMVIGNMRVAFVGSHLSSGQDNVSERNAEYQSISSMLKFNNKSINDHDVIFWMGDFNYRINLSNYEIRERIDQCDIEYLLSNDQLLVEKEKGSIFFGYEEGRIEFLPTYRINSATGYYDSGDDFRRPAWADRILYCGSGIRLLEYTCCYDGGPSDHRPVRGTFEVMLNPFTIGVENEYARNDKDVMRLIDL